MHRSNGSPAPYSRDLGPRRRPGGGGAASSTSTGGSSSTGAARLVPSRRFFASRTRLHPIFFIPVFLCGAFLAPYLGLGLGRGGGQGAGGERLPEPVYHPPDRDWTPQQVLAPADAPPLKREEDDYAGAFVPRRRGGGGNANGKRVQFDDLDDASDDSASSSSPYLIHAGLLYFRTSSALIPSHELERPFPVAPVRPHFKAEISSPDTGLKAPPPAPRDWLVPGEVFVHPPGRRKHLAAAAGAPPSAQQQQQRRPAAVPLRAPIPPAPAPARAQAPGVGGAGRQQPVAIRQLQGQLPVRDSNGHILGPNAAAMARAKREGRPFVPGTPAELLEKVKAVRQRKADEINAKRIKAEEPMIRQRQQEMLKQLEAEKKKKKAEQDMQPGLLLRKVDTDGRAGREAALLWDDDDGNDDASDNDQEDLDALDAELAHLDSLDHEDDAALLAAVRALTPAEMKDLSPEERELIEELEANEKRRVQQQQQGAAAPAPPPVAARRRGVFPLANPAPPPPPPMAAQPAAAPAGPAPAARRRPGWAAAHAQEPAVVPAPKKEKAGGGGDGGRQKQMAALRGGRPRQKRDLTLVVEEEETEAVDDSAEETDTIIAATAAADSATRPEQLVRRASIPVVSESDRQHPISYLIAKAEEDWEDMLRRQSQSLEQAVHEYKRRYKMNPPAGFDSWWRYAMQNRIVLVDEYDQIYDDILPFHSLPPSELRRRVISLKTDTTLPWRDYSFSFSIRDGQVQTSTESTGGKDDLLDIIGEIAKMLPDLEVRMNKGDEPAVVISGEARKRHEDLAKRQKVLPPAALYEIAEPTGFSPWDSLCPPNSTARRVSQGLPIDKPPKSASLRSLVTDEHHLAQDICEHPDVRELNGFTSWPGPRPHLLYPLFSPMKTSLHADLLFPSITTDYYTEVGRDPLWEQKKYNQVLWRGETTGAYHAKGTGWRKTQRARLVQLANENTGQTTFHIADPSTSDSLRLLTAPSKDVLPLYFDVAYTGSPIQCSTKDTTCQQLQRDYRFETKALTVDQENMYKYVVDVDANYASGKFKRLMSSRSLVFKSTIFPEWWSRRIMPWYHYIPIQSDYSDLVDAAAYFIGAPDGVGSHDKVAKRIAQQGKKWSDEHWREVDMTAYLFRLLLEYARLLNRDEKDLHSMDYL
ncbi:hypothetical protein JCM10908_000335 [Rhodotorula pacifica]|uniref:uncharacterized protein n=1 Tax=Rhodotorula pacifica TaxID=1495444 RepID=UPI003176DA3B